MAGALGALGTVVSMVGTIAAAGAQASAANQQAAAIEQRAKDEQDRARIEAENADLRAKEERAAGQQKAAARWREKRIAQSNLKAQAGASGAGSDDPTVLKIWEGIETEGTINANREQAYADQKANTINYQADLNTWTADRSAAAMRMEASARRAEARGTMLGGVFGAIGSGLKGFSSLTSKFGGYSSSRRAYG
jgi:hypothetical protein